MNYSIRNYIANNRIRNLNTIKICFSEFTDIHDYKEIFFEKNPIDTGSLYSDEMK